LFTCYCSRCRACRECIQSICIRNLCLYDSLGYRLDQTQEARGGVGFTETSGLQGYTNLRYGRHPDSAHSESVIDTQSATSPGIGDGEPSATTSLVEASLFEDFYLTPEWNHSTISDGLGPKHGQNTLFRDFDISPSLDGTPYNPLLVTDGLHHDRKLDTATVNPDGIGIARPVGPKCHQCGEAFQDRRSLE